MLGGHGRIAKEFYSRNRRRAALKPPCGRRPETVERGLGTCSHSPAEGGVPASILLVRTSTRRASALIRLCGEGLREQALGIQIEAAKRVV